jgi:hypothetical protein
METSRTPPQPPLGDPLPPPARATAPTPAPSPAPPTPEPPPPVVIVPAPDGFNLATLDGFRAEFLALADSMKALIGRMHDAIHDSKRK